MSSSKPYEIRKLTKDFYDEFDSINYPEILRKIDRPYLAMIVQIGKNAFAIPFRTQLDHNWGYQFPRTTRKSKTKTGLDFSKAVIVNDKRFIGDVTDIDRLEYTDLDANYHIIIKRFITYLNGYKRYATNKPNTYDAKKYKYTTLKYFHKELGLTVEENKELQMSGEK